MKIKKFNNFSNDFINETINIDGLEYPTTELNYKRILNDGASNYLYASNNDDDFYDKRNIRVYNHITKEHYYLENVIVKIGDSNLVFLDFPRTDAPIDSWSSRSTQHVVIRSWGVGATNRIPGDFVRYTIDNINDNGMCQVSDGYNKQSGWYARDCFYKITKIFK